MNFLLQKSWFSEFNLGWLVILARREAASTLCRRNLNTQLCFFFFLRIDLMSPIPPRRLEKKLLENALQPGGIWKRWLCVFVRKENILKTELFDNDGVTVIVWFLWTRLPQTGTNPKWLVILVFLNPPVVVRTENIWCAEWNLRFEFPPP